MDYIIYSLVYKLPLENNNKEKIFLVLFSFTLIGFISTQASIVERTEAATTEVEI